MLYQDAQVDDEGGAEIIPLRPVTAAERVLFRACKPPGDRRVADLLDELVDRGALTSAHLFVLLIHGSAGRRPHHDTDAHRLWSGAMSTLDLAFSEAGLAA